MAAANTDLVRLTTPNFATTLANSMLNTDTSMTLQSAVGLLTTTAITLVIDATDPVSGVATPNLKEVVTGTLSGAVLSNLVRGQDGTTQQSHAAGANVVMWWNANMINDFMNAFLAQHKQLGTHTGLTTDTINTSGNASVAGTLGVTGASTLTGAVGGAGYSMATMANPYKFSYYRTAALSPTGLVTFDTLEFDTGSNYSVSTGKFTAPIAGFYQINSQLRFAVTASIQNLEINLYKNGMQFKNGNMFINMYNGSSGVAGVSISTIVQLAATDYLQIFVVNSPTLALTGITESDNYFQGFLVSQT